MDNNKAITIFLSIITGAILLLIMKFAGSILLPIFVAILLSFILSPLVDGLMRIKIPRILSIAAALLVLVAIGYLVGLFLFSSLNSFIDEAPKYYKRFEEILKEISGMLNTNFSLHLPENPIAEINFTYRLLSSINMLSQNFVGFLSGLVIMLLSTIFLLLEAPYLQVTIAKAFPRKTAKQIIIIMRHTVKQIGLYLSLKAMVSAITGILVWFFLQVVGLDFALIWGVLAFFLNFIPSIGSLILMIITIFMGLVQFFPQPGPIIYVFTTMISVQIIVGNFFDPRLQGRRLNLSPIIILFSLFIWGWIWGPVGMFIAVPITAVVKIICHNIPQLRKISILMENGRKFNKNSMIMRFKK